MANETSTSSTKQLKQVLGFKDLLGTGIGQIIGAGIMTLMGSAIAMTGRSVPFAFLIAAVIISCQYLPMVLISGTVRLRGGRYTMMAMLAGQKMAGAYCIIFFFSNLSLSMYGISFASYFVSLFGGGNEKVIAIIVLTLFYVLNMFGIDKFAKVQNVIVICLVVALGAFAAFGVGEVDPNFFAEESFMTGGVSGLLGASGLLTFAVGGAASIVDLSAEAKRPTRDVPLAMICSTLIVAILYAFVAVVASGVLPVSEVAGQNLTIVAAEILPRPIYVFFIVCGAGFALISTLNAQFAWAPKPTMQACDDGWLPKGLAKLSKYNTPIVILTLLYGIAIVCVLTGISISSLGNMCTMSLSLATMLININLWRLPVICADAWETSKFKVSKGVMMLVTVVGTAAAGFNLYLNASRLDTPLLVINVGVAVVAFIFGIVRSKYAHVEVSYEKVS